MKRNVKIIIGVLIVFIGLCTLFSTYYLSLKMEVFDDMNKKYYEEIVKMEPVEVIDEEVVEEEDIQETTTSVITKVQTTTTRKTTTKRIESYVGILNIPKINLNRGFFDKNSKYNDVNINIYVHPSSSYPNKEKGNLILAAHSGTSSVSYFKNLDKLELNDDVYIEYNNVKYRYVIKNIYKVPKTGTVSITRNNNKNTLTLITCSKEDKSAQVVYICELEK